MAWSETSAARARACASNSFMFRRGSPGGHLLQFPAQRRAAVEREVRQSHLGLQDLAAQRDGPRGFRLSPFPQRGAALLFQRVDAGSPPGTVGVAVEPSRDRLQPGFPGPQAVSSLDVGGAELRGDGIDQLADLRGTQLGRGGPPTHGISAYRGACAARAWRLALSTSVLGAVHVNLRHHGYHDVGVLGGVEQRAI